MEYPFYDGDEPERFESSGFIFILAFLVGLATLVVIGVIVLLVWLCL